MLSSINKTELVECAWQMRAAKDTLVSKGVAPTSAVHVPSGLVFKRRRLEAPIPFENSHSKDRAPTQDALTIHECEVVGC